VCLWLLQGSCAFRGEGQEEIFNFHQSSIIDLIDTETQGQLVDSAFLCMPSDGVSGGFVMFRG
jgi:hypothetical protein